METNIWRCTDVYKWCDYPADVTFGNVRYDRTEPTTWSRTHYPRSRLKRNRTDKEKEMRNHDVAFNL